MDLTKFANALMFNCAAQPGLSAILLDLLDFEGPAIPEANCQKTKRSV